MRVLLAIIFVLVTAVSSGQLLSPREGYVQVEGGRVWYKIMGKGKGVPLLFIHGGPGNSSCPIVPEYALIGEDRPVIFYDQLGTGKSDRVWDTTLWRPERFADEIDSLRKALGLAALHILGQSWGGTVLIEYLSRSPKGIRSALFSGPLISTKIWMKDARKLLSQLPEALQDTINYYERIKVYDAPSYLAATDSFYGRFFCRYNMALLKKSMNNDPWNNSIYTYMWGPTEFTATGTLKNYDRIRDLKGIRAPVLFIAGEFDEVRLQTMKRFHQKVKRSQMIIIPDAGHYIQTDQPVLFVNSIRDFLDGK
jgi:proline iminopeptidase